MKQFILVRALRALTPTAMQVIQSIIAASEQRAYDFALLTTQQTCQIFQAKELTHFAVVQKQRKTSLSICGAQRR
jgi:uncharacterized protein (DUF697 family)